MGYRQTVQTQIRRRICLKDTSISYKKKKKWYKLNDFDIPKMMNGLFQLIRIEEFTQHKWVNLSTTAHNFCDKHILSIWHYDHLSS